MRVTDQARTDALIRNLHMRSGRLSSLYEKLATQQEVVRPSDDPIAADSIMRITSQISALEQGRDSMSYAQTFMFAAGEMLESGSDQMARAKVVALNAVNGTLSQASRNALADEVNQVLESMVQNANQSFDRRYLFSGAATDTPPVSVERNAAGEITSVAYEGSASPLELPLNDERSMTAGYTAREAFIDSDVMDSLISLRDHLRNTDGLSEADQIAALQSDLDRVDRASRDILNKAGAAGSRAATLDIMLNQTDNALTRAKEMLSNVRDADIAEIAVEMQKEQMIYESLLSASAQINRTSLLDYL
jgi:flagellar hook-associated protein 3 FlgL